MPETFSTSLQPLNWIQRNWIGQKYWVSSTKFVFFLSIGKRRWPSWYLIGGGILGFSSATAELNSTKLNRKQALDVLYQACVCLVDRKTKMAVPLSDWRGHFLLLLCYLWTEFNQLDTEQVLNVLYQVCVFRVDRKTEMAALASDTLILFRRLLCNRWTEFNKTWQEARTRHPLLSSVCFGPIGNQDCCPDFWLAERFLYSLQPLNRIQQNFTGSNISTSSTKFVFFGPIRKPKWPSWHLFDCEMRPLDWIQRNLKRSKYSSSKVMYSDVRVWPFLRSL